jgi:hypothetical protein
VDPCKQPSRDREDNIDPKWRFYISSPDSVRSRLLCHLHQSAVSKKDISFGYYNIYATRSVIDRRATQQKLQLEKWTMFLSTRICDEGIVHIRERQPHDRGHFDALGKILGCRREF